MFNTIFYPFDYQEWILLIMLKIYIFAEEDCVQSKRLIRLRN